MMNEIKKIVSDALQLEGQSVDLQADTPLLGNIPELDSMAVISVLTALEEHFGFVMEADQITSDVFTNLHTLTVYVEQKINI